MSSVSVLLSCSLAVRILSSCELLSITTAHEHHKHFSCNDQRPEVMRVVGRKFFGYFDLELGILFGVGVDFLMLVEFCGVGRRESLQSYIHLGILLAPLHLLPRTAPPPHPLPAQ